MLQKQRNVMEAKREREKKEFEMIKTGITEQNIVTCEKLRKYSKMLHNFKQTV